MVGVPGRSKGCHTCKRRKVKCDTGRPECQNCLRSGRRCEGYERDAVFLNRTIHGMARRRHLEEARPGGGFQSQVLQLDGDSHATTTSSTFQNPAVVLERGSLSPDARFLIQQFSLNNPINSFAIDCENAFLNYHRTIDTRTGSTETAGWIILASRIAQPGDALDKSLNALFITRMGRRRNDRTMIRSGIAAYGSALRSLQIALWDPVLVLDDRTLAACQALKTYELHESSQKSVKGFDSHVNGLIRLLQQRGPERNNSVLTKALADEGRFNAMIYALQYRKRNPLGEGQWRPQTWTLASDVEQSLYDHGFAIAALAEDLKSAEQTSQLDATFPISTNLFSELTRIGMSLVDWHARVTNTIQLSSNWTFADLDAVANGNIGEMSRVISNIQFDAFKQALLMMNFWALRVILDILLLKAVYVTPIQALPAQAREQCSPEVALNRVKNITETATRILAGEYGGKAISRCLFPLRASLTATRAIPSAEAVVLKGQCEDLLRRLSEANGVQHADALRKVCEEWDDPRMRDSVAVSC